MPITIAICDDDRRTVREIARLAARQAPGARDIPFYRAETLLAAAEGFDIIFLDIQMQGTNGIEAARQLRQRHPPQEGPIIIFVTAHEGFMPDAFDVGAFHYLMKPLDEGKFAEVFGRVLHLVKYRRRPQRSILLKTRDHGQRRIELRHIQYMESDNKRVIVQTLEGPLVCVDQINRLQEALGPGFFRCHRSYLVNLDQVVGFTRDTVQLAGGATVLMAKRNFSALPAAIMRHERAQEEAGG